MMLYNMIVMSTPHSIDYKYLFEEAFRRWRILQLSNKYADNPALSLDAFADYLSFSQSAISQWMSGNRTPSNRSLEAVLPGLISLFGNDPIIDDLYEAIGIETSAAQRFSRKRPRRPRRQKTLRHHHLLLPAP